MTSRLDGKRIAILATDGFEQSELTEPLSALRQAGATVDIVAPHDGKIQGMKHHEKGDSVAVTRSLKDADTEALVLPGGVANPDALRIESKGCLCPQYL